MDDIIEKLSLLDYENAFCKGWKHKRISRVYFANTPELEGEDVKERIHLFYDLIYWLISLNKLPSKWELIWLAKWKVGTHCPLGGNTLPAKWEQIARYMGTNYPLCGNNLLARWEHIAG